MKILKRALVSVAALVSALALASPASAYVDKPFVPAATDDPALFAAAQTWQAMNFDDYTTKVRFHSSAICAMTGACEWSWVTTVVRDGKVSEVRFERRNRRLSLGYSMDELFQMIREGHESGSLASVVYSSRGVPKRFGFDHPDVTDDDRGYAVLVTTP